MKTREARSSRECSLLLVAMVLAGMTMLVIAVLSSASAGAATLNP
jgi:hypothetical protein